jgi:hypothetical protein
MLRDAAFAIGEEIAAFAVAFDGETSACILKGTQEPWSPLADDGDALRLLVTLGVKHPTLRGDHVMALAVGCGVASCEFVRFNYRGAGDACSATRRSIVMAAAKIGKLAREQQGRRRFHLDPTTKGI